MGVKNSFSVKQKDLFASIWLCIPAANTITQYNSTPSIQIKKVMPNPWSKLEQRRDSTTEEAIGATIKQAKEHNHERTVKDNKAANTCWNAQGYFCCNSWRPNHSVFCNVLGHDNDERMLQPAQHSMMLSQDGINVGICQRHCQGFENTKFLNAITSPTCNSPQQAQEPFQLRTALSSG